MKLLFDQNLSYKLARDLQDSFPGSAQVRRLGLSDADDRTIWQYAKANSFTIVTHDIDFKELSLLYGFPPKVILLRIGNTLTNAIVSLLTANIDVIREFHENSNLACLELY